MTNNQPKQQPIRIFHQTTLLKIKPFSPDAHKPTFFVVKSEGLLELGLHCLVVLLLQEVGRHADETVKIQLPV